MVYAGNVKEWEIAIKDGKIKKDMLSMYYEMAIEFFSLFNHYKEKILGRY